MKMKGITGVGSAAVESVIVEFGKSVGGGGGGISTGEAEMRRAKMLRVASTKWRGPKVLMMN